MCSASASGHGGAAVPLATVLAITVGVRLAVCSLPCSFDSRRRTLAGSTRGSPFALAIVRLAQAVHTLSHSRRRRSYSPTGLTSKVTTRCSARVVSSSRRRDLHGRLFGGGPIYTSYVPRSRARAESHIYVDHVPVAKYICFMFMFTLRPRAPSLRPAPQPPPGTPPC